MRLLTATFRCAWTYGDDVRYVADARGKYGYNMVLGDRRQGFAPLYAEYSPN
jgi:hypothetical protein